MHTTPQAKEHWPTTARQAVALLGGRTGAVWGAAVALALGLLAQRLLDAQIAPAGAVAAYGAAMLLGTVCRVLRAEPASAEPAPAREAGGPPLGAILVLAGALAVSAFAMLGGNRYTPAGTALWVAAILLLVLGCLPAPAREWLAGRRPLCADRRRLVIGRSGLALAVAIGIGAFLRLYQLSEIPREMGTDVPHVVGNVRTILEGEYPIFFISYPGREGLFFYLTAPLARWFGLSHTTVKLSSALVGLSCIPLIYLLGKELFDRSTGVAAALLLAMSHWHVICSRSGLRAGSELPLMMLAWLWLARGLRRGRRWEFLLAGLALGLGMHTYNAFVAVPLAMGALLLGEFVMGRGGRVRAQRGNLLLLVVAALVVFAPLARYAWDDPRWYVFRVATRLTGLERALPDDMLGVLAGNIWRALRMFHFQGDSVYATNVPYLRELGYLTAVLFALGVAQVACRPRKGYNLAVLMTLGITLLPTVLSLAFPQEVPNAFRAIGALPPAMLLAAVGLAELWRAVRAGLLLTHEGDSPRRAAAYVVAATMGLGLLGGLAVEASTTARTYLVDFRLSQPRRNYAISLEMARTIDDYSDGEAYSVSWPHWVDGNAVREQLVRTDPSRWHDVPSIAPGAPPLTDPRALVIVHPDDTATQSLLREAFPRGVLVTHRDDEGDVAFLAFYGAR